MVGLAQSGEALTRGVISPLQALGFELVQGLPNLVIAIIVLIVGCFVAVILGHFLRLVLEKLKVDDYIKKAHLTKTAGHTHVPAIAGELFKWWIIILFLQQAVELINLGVLSDYLARFVNWLPSVLVAVVILLFGTAVAHYIHFKLEEHSRLTGIRTAARILKAVIWVIVVLIALDVIGVNIDLASDLVKIVVTAIAAGIALAFGLGFGLGAFRQESGKIYNDIKRNF
ncbi:hypothetical protein HYT58_00420 [Candidatus Woesearchaeota archaeon]|nr:hypothetical protein [Candidatus Woesearchaeota archaeon]